MLFSPCKARSKKSIPFRLTSSTLPSISTIRALPLISAYPIRIKAFSSFISFNMVRIWFSSRITSSLRLTASPSSVCQSPSICFKMDVLVWFAASYRYATFSFWLFKIICTRKIILLPIKHKHSMIGSSVSLRLFPLPSAVVIS